MQLIEIDVDSYEDREWVMRCYFSIPNGAGINRAHHRLDLELARLYESFKDKIRGLLLKWNVELRAADEDTGNTA